MNKEEIKKEMEGVVQIFRHEIAVIRTGRATPALIEGLELSVYGGREKMKLVELGTILVAGARNLVFQPWDKTIINEIKNGILQSGVKLIPIVDNDKIRIELPPLTTDQRENYIELIKKKLEAGRVMIRGVRSQNRYKLQEQLREKQLSEDEHHRLEEELQKITDDYIDRLEEMEEKKEKEIRS